MPLSNADFRYQPGCHAVYRRYGNTTVSTSNQVRWLESHKKVLHKAEQALIASDRMSPGYRCSLAASYFSLAHTWHDLDASHHRRLLDRALQLCPHFSPDKPLSYRIVRSLFGLHFAENVGWAKRRAIRSIHTRAAQRTVAH